MKGFRSSIMTPGNASVDEVMHLAIGRRTTTRSLPLLVRVWNAQKGPRGGWETTNDVELIQIATNGLKIPEDAGPMTVLFCDEIGDKRVIVTVKA